MRLLSAALLFSSLLVLSAGCTGNATSTSDNSAAPASGATPATSDVHAHPSEGPHHGTLVELGSGEYHAEVTHDATSVTVYILDGQAKQAVPLDATEVTINLLHDGTPQQFKLLAQPEQGDPAGKASRFSLADAELAGHIDDESAAPKLSLTISGTPYRGEIHHDHGHDHAH